MRAIHLLTCLQCSQISNCLWPQEKVGPISRVSVSRLIRADGNFLSRTNAACTIYSNMLVSYSPPLTIKEGDMAIVFYRTQDWRQWRKRVPTDHRPLFFRTSRLQVLQGMSVCKTFHANIRRSDLLMLNIKWNITQKLDPTLKPSNYKQLRKKHMFPH